MQAFVFTQHAGGMIQTPLIAAMHTDLNSKHPAISLKQLKAAELPVILFESTQEGCLQSAHLQAISTYIHIR